MPMSMSLPMVNRGIRIPADTLLALRTRLAGLPPRSAARREEVGRIADLFGVSSSTVYRALKSLHQPKGLRRADRGKPRGVPEKDMAQYCEIIAALKIRTSNKKRPTPLDQPGNRTSGRAWGGNAGWLCAASAGPVETLNRKSVAERLGL